MDPCLYTFGASPCLKSDPLFLPCSLYNMVIGSIVWSAGVIVFVVVAVVMSAGAGVSVRAILTGGLNAG